MTHTPVFAGRRLGVVSLSIAVSTATMMLVTLTGCAEKKPVTPPPVQQLSTVQTPASRTQQRLNTLQSFVDALSDSSKALPGRTEAAHRQLMAEVFSQLQGLLPMLAIDPDTGAFRQQLEILEQSQHKLTSQSAKGLDQPIINTGLRAAANALTPLAAELNLSNAAELIKPIDDNLHALDAATGPLHRLAATDVVKAETNLVKALATAAAQRMNVALKLNEASTTKEASSPATAPVVRKAAQAPASAAPAAAKAATPSATQLIPTTVPAEPTPPPADQPTPRAATQTSTPSPAPAAPSDLNKQ